MKQNAINADFSVNNDGFSIVAGRSAKRALTVSGGNITFVASGDYTYTLPAGDANLGEGSGGGSGGSYIVNQWNSGPITASYDTPYIHEITVDAKVNYDFPPVSVLRFHADEADGRWRCALHGLDYEYEFYGTNTLRLEFYTSGVYKVNH